MTRFGAMKRWLSVPLLAIVALALAACAGQPLDPAKRPLSMQAMHLLGKKGMDARASIFIRIFKEESELEVWKARADGRFYHFKTYPICNWSGGLGPKRKQGDKQAPEGFYTVRAHQMNPNSKFHLSFNLGYPNRFDKSHRRTGNFLMVHGKCKSAGCYAMTDALMEEIYALAREAFRGGQKTIHVHAFPFRMTDANLERFRKHRWIGFWRELKTGYDDFELTRTPPKVAVCGRRYHVNVDFKLRSGAKLKASAQCPRFERAKLVPFFPTNPTAQQLAKERVVAPGPKRRSFADIHRNAPRYGLTRAK
ncbi:MAG: murein L,D-transpeptidase family protein [Pseudomonadota bacterium]